MKKILAVMLVVLVLAATPITAFAGRHHAGWYAGTGYNSGGGYSTGSYAGAGFMCDANGNLLSRDSFVKKLDGAIADGYISKDSRSVMIERYDYCAEYGYGNGGGYGRGCGAGWCW